MIESTHTTEAHRPAVSVVLPTFRRVDMLERAIHTVMDQTLRDWELIVVDDNGAGHAAQRAASAVIDRFGHDPRIVYVVHEQNRGGGAARNTGIARARAELVAFLDDDDAWFPHKLALQVACFERSAADVALVYGGFQRVAHDGRRRIVQPDPAGSHVSVLLRRNAIGTTSLVMCKRHALESIGGFDPGLRSRQDLDLFVRLAQRYAFAFVDEPLLDKYEHDALSIGKDQEGLADAHRRFYEKHRSAYESDPSAHHVVLHRYAEEVLRTGRAREARRLFFASWRKDPRRLRTLAYALLSWRFALDAYRSARRLLGLGRRSVAPAPASSIDRADGPRVD